MKEFLQIENFVIEKRKNFNEKMEDHISLL